jgi:hypothetical protein
LVGLNAGLRRHARKRVKGLEPSTFSLGSCEHRSEATQTQELTDDTANACTNACTSEPDSVHSDTADDAPDTFAEALAMVARLPLTDAERAEAVRRLLAAAGG